MTLRYQEPSRASLALMLEQCEGFREHMTFCSTFQKQNI